jgi:hypothetical protein
MKKYIIFLLSLVLITSCSIVERESLSAEMRGQLKKLPHDANLIGHINFAKMKSSPVFDLFQKDIEDEMFQSEEYQDFLKSTGFDIEKDIHEVYFAAISQEKIEGYSGIFIASGTFNPDKIIAYVQEQDMKKELLTETYDQFTLYYFEEEKLYFCFKDDKTIIGGSQTLVIKALTEENSETDLVLMPQIKSLRYKSWAWMTMNTESILKKMQANWITERMQFVKSIRSASMAIKLTDNLYFNGECLCSDNEKAGLLKDALKGAIAAAKLSVSDDRGTIDVLNGINVETENNLLITNGEMSKNDIEKLIAQKNKVLSI